MIGSEIEGFINVNQFIQPFKGRLVTDPESLNDESIENIFGDQEVLTIVIDIPEENVDYFESLTKKIGWFDGEQMKRYEPVLESA